MVNGILMCVLFVSGVFQTGLTALIETPQTVMAAAGDKACLNCQLMQSKDVLQVTWQKMLPEGEKNLATYNRYFGERVNAGFEGKVAFKDAGLQNCSIFIREVTEKDEGCYRCLFNTYPDGALTATTCLLLYELHEPVLHVALNSPEEAAVSCSATGRPAPTVTLTVPHYNSSSVTNTNGTVTVTATAVLPRLHDDSTVGCAVLVLSGPQIKTRAKVKQSSVDGFAEKTRSDNSDHNFTLITVLSVIFPCVVLVAAIFSMWFITKHQNRQNTREHEDTEKNKTPQKTIKNTHEPRTPLLDKVNELRLRLSTGKSEKCSRPKESSPASKCQKQLSFTKEQRSDTE